MNKRTKLASRFICLVLAVIMILPACGTTEENRPADLTEYMGLYQPEYVSWQSDITNLPEAGLMGSSAYAIVRHKTDGIQLVRVPLPGGEAYVLAAMQNEAVGSISTSRNIITLCPVKGGVWYMKYTGTQDTGDPLYTKHERLYELVHTDDSGTVLARIDISDAVDGNIGIRVAADDSGNVAVLNNSKKLHAYGKNGETLFSADISSGAKLVRSADGSVYVHQWSGAMPYTKSLIPVNFKAKKLGSPTDITDLDLRWISAGYGSDDFYYEGADGIYALTLDGLETRLVLDYSRHSIKTRTVDTVSRNENGDFTALENSRATADITCFPLYLQAVENIVFDPGNPDSFPPIMREKTVLTYRTSGVSIYIRDLISDFNQNNDDYIVEIVDYSEITDGNLLVIRDLMLMDIAAGKPTDLIDLNYMHMPRSSWGNLVLDLYPFLDADPKYGRDTFVPSVLEALDYNGTLPRLARDFSIETLVGKQSIFGTNLGWSFEDMRQLQATLPDGTYLLGDFEQIVLFNMLLFMGTTRFIDEDSATCCFNSDEFISMLEWCANLKQNPKYATGGNTEFEDVQELVRKLDEDLRSETILLTRCEIASPRAVKMFKDAFGEEVCFIGYPGSLYGASFETSQTFSISATSQHPQGAWEFIRSALPSSTAGGRGLPVIAAELEALLKAEMQPPETVQRGFNYYEGLMRYVGNSGVSSRNWVDANADLNRYALTREEAQQFMDIVDAVPAWRHIDSAVYDIVHETAGQFFAGEKTAAETAEIIQNRVSTLLSERS